MAKQCEICKKKPLSGHNVSHSNRHTKRRWLPNLQSVKLNGKKTRVCTGCLKTITNKSAA